MRNNKKGFTLAELLIVVAIIAVLVAISIPIFVNQVEKAKESTDAANIRDYYAEIAVGVLNDQASGSGMGNITLTGGKTATYAVDGTTGFTYTVPYTPEQSYANWDIGTPTVAGVAITLTGSAAANDATEIVYTFVNNASGSYLSAVALNK